MNILSLCSIILGVIIMLAMIIMYVLYKYIFLVPELKKHDDPYNLPKDDHIQIRKDQINAMLDRCMSLPCEDVWIKSHDGYKLHGRYFHTADGAPVQILFHGYRSNAYRDFAGGLLLAVDSGCNVLLVDQRAHGESEGKCLSFGINERKDCRRWVDYIVSRFGADVKIILTGISMGAATVMMAAGPGIQKNVVGVISDCGYTSPKEILKEVATSRGMSAKLYPLARWAGKIFGGFDVEEYSAIEAMKSCQVPMLFIHGDADKFVPVEMGRENFAACTADKTILIVPGAAHGISFMVDEAAYTEYVRKFLKKVC